MRQSGTWAGFCTLHIEDGLILSSSWSRKGLRSTCCFRLGVTAALLQRRLAGERLRLSSSWSRKGLRSTYRFRLGFTAALLQQRQARDCQVLVEEPLQTGDYGSALAVAAYWGRQTCVEAFIKGGAKVKLMLDNGLFITALEAAVTDVSSEDVERIWWDGRKDESRRREKAAVADLLRYHAAGSL